MNKAPTWLWFLVGGGLLYALSKTSLGASLTAKKGTAAPSNTGVAPAYRAIVADPTNAQNYANLITAGSGALTSVVNAAKSTNIFGSLTTPTPSPATTPAQTTAWDNSFMTQGFDGTAPDTSAGYVTDYSVTDTAPVDALATDFSVN